MKTVPVIALAMLATVAVIAQSGMRPGQWEVTAQTQMGAMQMPETKLTQCVTPEQAKDPASSMRGPQGRGVKEDCKNSNYTMTGNKATWTTTCTSPEKYTVTGEMTFGNDTYITILKMNMAQGEMTMKMSGKRIGDCTP